MNTARRGTKIERKAIKILESLGMIVYRTERNRFGRRNDIFGCFDIIAKDHSGTAWIQVTTQANVSTKKKDVDKTMPDYLFFDATEVVEVWGYVPERGASYFNIYLRSANEGWKLRDRFSVVK